ncbi:hypothetical protein ACIGHN_13335 [Acidovorax sp. NPDC077693]|uniref:hypothetical protein n=1 Tax=unclassified Acidovorax TaxID=2684926 RepID=UPI0037C6E7C0
MRIEILNELGAVINEIDADTEFAAANYPPGAWRLAENQDLPQSLVPQKVSRRQARRALALAGLLDQVQPAIDAIPDPLERQLAQIDWDDSQEFERHWPLLVSIGLALGLTEQDKDDLFIRAGAM